MFGRKKPLTLESRIAAASAVELFDILDENLQDKSSFGRRGSVSISEVDDICLVKTTDYETCMEACHNLASGERLKMARLWAFEADAMRRIAAADMFACETDADDPALHGILDIIARLTADREKAVIIAALDAFCFFQDKPDPAILGRIQKNCEQHPDRAIRWNFINAFPNLSADDLSPLIRLSSESESRIRAVACEKLAAAFQFANSRMQAAIGKALQARLNDSNGLVRLGATEALKMTGQRPVDPAEAAGLKIYQSVWGKDGGKLNIEALNQLSPEEIATMKAFENACGAAFVTAAIAGDESDAAERIRSNGESDRRRAKATGLLSMDLDAADRGLPPPGFQERIAGKTIVELFEIIHTAQRCFRVAHHANRMAVEECQRRPSGDIRTAAEAWAKTRDMRDNNNLHIVELFLGNDARETITRRLAGKAPLSKDVSVLIGQLNARDEETVIEALRGLGKHLRQPRDPAMLMLMQGVERHPDQSIRAEYAQLFENPKTSAELAILLRLALDPAYLVRSKACEGLANCKPETSDIREAIACFLDDDELWLRRRAISILAGRKDPRVVDAIAAELQADEETISLIVENNPVELWDLIRKAPRRRYLDDLGRWQKKLREFETESNSDFILKAIAACQAPGVPF